MTKSRLLLLLFSLLLSIASYSQDTIKRPIPYRRQPNPLPTFPMYPGGKDSLATFLKKNTHYPKAARKHHISGMVEVDFIVTKNGTLEKPHVLKPLGYGCDEEAIRIVNLMPKWIPSRQGRDPIELDYHVTIPFGKQ